MNKHYSKNNHCKCGKLITDYAKQCLSCSHKGKLCCNYIDGRTTAKYYCVDCGVKLKNFKAKRCSSCAKSGKLSPRYIDGRSSKNHYCKDCNKLVGKFASKRCVKCSGKKRRKFVYTIKLIKTLYWKHQMSITKIAKQIGCSHQTIHEQMIRYNIKRRTRSECKKGILNPMYGKFGIKHHRYLPNIQREYPIKFNDKLKETVRKRDKHTCQNCGLKQCNSYRKLDVHHIDYICHLNITNSYINSQRRNK